VSYQTVIVLDFGGQYKELIARRVRECGVYSVILPGDVPLTRIREMDPIGIILTGGPDSVYREGKVESVEYGATVDVVAICTPRLLGQLKDYIEGWTEEKEEWEM
jgi:GMP synthase (glutamine-hydrolysing)